MKNETKVLGGGGYNDANNDSITPQKHRECCQKMRYKRNFVFNSKFGGNTMVSKRYNKCNLVVALIMSAFLLFFSILGALFTISEKRDNAKALPGGVGKIIVDFGVSLTGIDTSKLNGWEKSKNSDTSIGFYYYLDENQITIPFDVVYEATGKHFRVPYTHNETTIYFDEYYNSGVIYSSWDEYGLGGYVDLVAEEYTEAEIAVNVSFVDFDKNSAITPYLCLNYIYNGGMKTRLLTKDNLTTFY